MTETKNNPFRLDLVSVRLVKDSSFLSDSAIRGPQDAVGLLGKYLCELDREVLCVINMTISGIPINCNIASMGAIDKTFVNPREIFKASILSNAANMILMHNHTDGILTPSKQDTMITDQMAKACGIMGIPLLDHVIVGGDNAEYFSFREKKLLPVPDISLATDYRTFNLDTGLAAEMGRSR